MYARRSDIKACRRRDVCPAGSIEGMEKAVYMPGR